MKPAESGVEAVYVKVSLGHAVQDVLAYAVE